MPTSSWRAAWLALGVLLAAAPDARQDARAQDTVRAGALAFSDIGYDDAKFGSVKIGRVTLQGVVRTATGFSADSITATDIVLTHLSTTTTVPVLTITGFTGPGNLLEVLSGARPQVDWLDVLSKVEAGRIVIDSSVARLAAPTTTQESTTTGIKVERLQGGRAARLGFDRQEMRADGPDAMSPIRITAGATLHEKIDLVEALRFEIGGGEGPAKLLFERMTIDGIDFDGMNGAIRARTGPVELRGLFGRAPREVLRETDFIGGADALDPAVTKKIADLFEDLSATFRLDAFSIASFSLDVSKAAIKTGKIDAKGYTFNAVESFELRDLSATTDVGELTVGRFALDNFHYEHVTSFFIEVVGKVAALQRGAAPPSLSGRDVLKLVPTGSIRLENVEASSSTGQSGSVGGLAIETTASGELIDTVTATLTGAMLDIAALPPTDATAKLIELGYPEIVWDARLALRYDKAAKTLTLERSGAAFGDAGRLEATLRIADVDAEALLDAGAGAQAMAVRAPFGSLTIDVADLGLAQRFYASVAKSAGVAPETIRDGLAAEIRNQTAKMLGPALTPGAADAVAQFLRRSGRLTIWVEPRSDRPPLTIGDIQRMPPPQLADRVMVTIEASAP